MSLSSFRRINEFLQDSASIDSLNSAITRQSVIHDLWLELVGDEIANHTHIRIENRTLTIYANLPIWAHTVNQQRITLLDALKERDANIDSIRVVSCPSSPIPSVTDEGSVPKSTPTAAMPKISN